MQTAALLVLSPIFEADLPPEQYAYRPGRSAHDAVKRVHRLLNTGHQEVVDADLSDYFGQIPHAELLKSVARRVSDGRMLGWVKAWLEMAVEEDDRKGGKHRTNRALTFGDRAPGARGRQWVQFIVASQVGLVSNVGVYVALTGAIAFFYHYRILALIAGVVVGMAANFMVADR